MKMTHWCRVVFGLLLTVATAVASADRLRVVTDPSFVPFEMLQPSGEMVGFDMDIIAEVARRAGFDYELRTMDFNGIIPALQTGNVDMAIAGISITAKRGRVVDFSKPYYDSGLRILVRQGGAGVATIGDLEGRRVGTKIGSTSYDFLMRKLDDADGVTPYPGSADMYMALLAGAVDAVFYDAPNVAYFARTRGEGRVEVVGPLYEGQQYGIALRSGSEWLQPVNEALRSMRQDGSYQRIYQRWFGAPGSSR